MKSFALAALVATVANQQQGPIVPTYGEGCQKDPTVCEATGETCVQWSDQEDYPRFTCQDCVGTQRNVTDEYGTTDYLCPGEEAVPEGAFSLTATIAGLAGAAAMMF